jgi:hypothetical protein
LTHPLPHGWPGVPPEIAPQPPHAFAAGWQLVPSQQPPLHVRPPAHDVLHVCVVVLQAWFDGQSPGAEQPHAPDTQACPAAEPEQSAQVLPPAPHTLLAAPAAHSPVDVSQQPPLHFALAPHKFVHAFVVGSHA